MLSPMGGKSRLDPQLTTRAMAGVRLISASIELTAAYLMVRSSLPRAVSINAVLGLAGPVIFTVVSALGIVGLAGRISPLRLIVVSIGVALVLLSTRVA